MARRAAPDTSGDPMIRPDWHDRANCGRNGIIGDDAAARIDLMFATDQERSDEALTVCDGCPVKRPCAVTRREVGGAVRDMGVWAGVAPPRPRKTGRPVGIGASLTSDQVREMRRRFMAGEKQKDIAADYKISQASLSGIVRKRSYRWVS